MKKEEDRMEEYLAEVVNRLMDTEGALEATLIYCKTRKEVLVTDGKDFQYDQGRIDACVEMLDFVSGKISMQKLRKLMSTEKKQESEPRKEGMMDVI